MTQNAPVLKLSHYNSAKLTHMAERYDKREDRANDRKTHDNPNHESRHTYEKNLEESDYRMKHWQDDITDTEE